MRLTEAQIEAGRSPKGGWTRQQLAKWGVPWPPPKGWRAKLTGREDRPMRTPERVVDPFFRPVEPEPEGPRRMKNSAADFPNIPWAAFYFSKPYQSRSPRKPKY
jgi:hypothetical protein